MAPKEAREIGTGWIGMISCAKTAQAAAKSAAKTCILILVFSIETPLSVFYRLIIREEKYNVN